MANTQLSQTDVTGSWKVGDAVNIGTLKGLIVTAIVAEGSLQKFSLKHPTSQKEYTFVPGGLRKTYEPPTTLDATTQVSTANHNVRRAAARNDAATKAIARAKTILTQRCRRRADASLRAELQEVIALLSPAALGGNDAKVGQTADGGF